MIKLSWEEVYERLKQIPDGVTYGVPRGGAIVSGMKGNANDNPLCADFIVDDIIDSGKTKEKYEQIFKKPFYALVDKQKEGITDWVVFPWEEEAEKDIEDTVIRQLEFIGEDPKRGGLIDTPKRVIKALGELTSGYKENPSDILSKVFEEPYDEMVVVKDIEFWSLCEHHMLPFHGKVSVGYIPNGKIVGLSKIPRLIYCFSRRLQVQERLTQQIAYSLWDVLKPMGVGVYVEAQHTCMAMRGAKATGTMATSCLLGVIRDTARSEFLKLISK